MDASTLPSVAAQRSAGFTPLIQYPILTKTLYYLKPPSPAAFSLQVQMICSHATQTLIRVIIPPMETQALPKIEIIPDAKTKHEPPYRVLIHNDNVTPMDFVVNVLQKIFMLGMDRAVEVMYSAHFKGVAYVQTLTRAEAERRIQKAHFAAGLEGYPLLFSMEPE